MSANLPWIRTALEELGTLEQRHAAGALSPDDAYRVRVLHARLEQARAAGWDLVIPESLSSLAGGLAADAAPPEAAELLSQLDSLLSEDEDPFGELLDVLLATDDAATVADSSGRTSEAGELVRLADAYVSLDPARVSELGTFAERRLATLPPAASIRPLWESISRAAGDAAVEALPPAVPAPAFLRDRALVQRLNAARRRRIEEDISRAPLFERLTAAAAAAPHPAGEDTFEGQEVGLFEDAEGRWHVQVELPPGRRATGELELHVSVEGRTAVWQLRIGHQSRRALIAELGTFDALRERLRAAGFSPPGPGLRVVVTVALEETPE